MTTRDTSLLRPALELAWAVARAGLERRPVVTPPGRLRPLLGFARLPDRALAAVAEVVEEDGDFRARVAEGAEEAALGRASWLWLARPDGWEEELDRLGAEAAATRREVAEDRAERAARRRLGAVEAALSQTEAELAEARQSMAALGEEVAGERRARRAAETARDDLDLAVRAAEAAAADRAASAGRLEGRVRELEALLAETRGALAAAEAARDAARREAAALAGAVAEARQEATDASGRAGATRQAVAAAVARAAAAAGALADALGAAGRALDEPGTGDAGGRVGGEGGPADAPIAAEPCPAGGPPPGARRARPARRPGRAPVALPPAVLEDSAEAAAHLVRVPGMLLLVDGYNVSLSTWPELDLGAQRSRLVAAVAELAMRSGVAAHVVFDGHEHEELPRPPSAARRAVRVSFSPPGVDADEVLIDAVEDLAPGCPVAVVTDDRRVRDEVRRRGANVLSVAQLLAVMGRVPGSRH